jgi:hypothetical protein
MSQRFLSEVERLPLQYRGYQPGRQEKMQPQPRSRPLSLGSGKLRDRTANEDANVAPRP